MTSESSKRLINTIPAQSMFSKNCFYVLGNGEEVEAIAPYFDLNEDFLFLQKSNDSTKPKFLLNHIPLIRSTQLISKTPHLHNSLKWFSLFSLSNQRNFSNYF
jgi:hypothetical protein